MDQDPVAREPEPVAAAAATRSAGAIWPRLVPLTLASLTRRMRRGEGLLVALNAVLAVVVADASYGVTAARLALSLFVLAAAYAVNDWRDAEADRSDPKKDQRLVRELIDLRQPFGAWLAALHVALVAFALVCAGAPTAAATAAMLALNAIYSWWLKRVPVADLAVVGACGAAYAAIAAPESPIWPVVGLMTAIMHVYQVQQDRDVDRANGIGTCAVRLPRATHAAAALLCVALYFALLRSFGAFASLSAAVPFVLRLALRSTAFAWMGSRGFFGVVLTALILRESELGAGD